ncbi:choice-of-anchor tandem repeat GloVer-containing protein [Methylocystis heyeri]|uniref:Uncharacterized protein n=1 Tax=Methylocystis heyeri TaxID=391905 RepID=A0A6B8KEQ2_9HYPH|nr:choice-of-anchor tandem repeat GloVer-containing protein [Methylocystis heyeri]QGM44923.1 hypothetical protein H2LOC_004040 [Methylocystis heyeri]
MNIRNAFRFSRKKLPLAAVLVAGAANPVLAQTWPPTPLSETALYSFTGSAAGGSPGLVTLLADSKGALYGTTLAGGANGNGVVFKLAPPAFGKSQWTESVLYSFSASDGAGPYSGLVRDSVGALYGVTQLAPGTANLGAAFRLTPPVSPSTQWSYARIYDFALATGADPYGPPVFDNMGALIGAARYGGYYNGGTIYKITPPASAGAPWTGAALYNFTAGADGANPQFLSADSNGTIYGTTQGGGSGGKGVVFKLTPSGANCTPVFPNLWCETVLYKFSGTDGAAPLAGLSMDSSGTLYGTTSAGGAHNLGVVFSLTPPIPPSTQWQETVLYSFAGGQDAATPYSPVTLMGGSLYGATYNGGGTGCGGLGCGALFQLAPPVAPATRWTENILYRFAAGGDGGFPQGGLIFNELRFGAGLAAYGVTNVGGTSNAGVVFALQCAKATREVFGGAQHAACTP